MLSSRLRRLPVALLLCLASLFVANGAEAKQWRVDPSSSKLAFTYREDGEKAFGAFESFSGSGSFESAAPQNARLDLRIQIDSIRLKDAVRSSLVKTETWFDAKNIPTARFQLKKLTPMKKAGFFRAEGVLTIKSISRRIRPVIRLDIKERSARARGQISFKRSHFRVGDPTLSLFVDVSDKITVNFDIRAARR